MRPPEPELRRRPRPEGAQFSERSRVGSWQIAAVVAVVALLLYAVRYALVPVVFAIAIAFVTDPIIVAVQVRFGVRRWIVASATYILLLATVAVGGYALAGTAIEDFLHLIARAPQIADDLLRQVVGERGITVLGQTYTSASLIEAMVGAIRRATGFGLAVKTGELAVSILFGAVLTLVLTPFLMISGPRLAAGAIWLIPPERRGSVVALLPKLLPVLRRYLVGIAIVVAYTTMVAWVGFTVVAGLHNAALLALTVGILEIVPVVGPAAAMALVGLTAVQQATLYAAIVLMVFVVALRLSIDNLVGPLVLGQAAHLHPVVIIAAFVFGAVLFGVVGLLLAVPTAVCINVSLEQYYAEPIRPEEA